MWVWAGLRGCAVQNFQVLRLCNGLDLVKSGKLGIKQGVIKIMKITSGHHRIFGAFVGKMFLPATLALALAGIAVHAATVVNYVSGDLTLHTLTIAGSGFPMPFTTKQKNAEVFTLGTSNLTVLSQTATQIVTTLPTTVHAGSYPMALNGLGLAVPYLTVTIGNTGAQGVAGINGTNGLNGATGAQGP